MSSSNNESVGALNGASTAPSTTNNRQQPQQSNGGGNNRPQSGNGPLKRSYVPPHLRGKGGEAASSAPADDIPPASVNVAPSYAAARPTTTDFRREEGGYSRGGARGGGGDRPSSGFGGGQDGRFSRSNQEDGGGGGGGRDNGRFSDRGYGRSGGGGVGPGVGLDKRDPKLEAELFGEFKNNTGINFDKYDDIPVEVSGEDIPTPFTRYGELSLHEILADNVLLCGYEVPTPVQKNGISIALARRDLMACAQTGSGM